MGGADLATVQSLHRNAAPPRRLGRSFFEQPGDELAPAMLGKVLIRKVRGVTRRARIVEVEAYLGPRDLASHSSKGRTRRTEVMFGPAGHAYVYFIYGMHWMFNVVAGVTGEAHAILVRGAQPLDGWDVNLHGPGRFARGFGIGRFDNGLDLTEAETYFIEDSNHRPRILRSKRIGVDYARHWKDRLLRFIDASEDEKS